jgi:hypothetical protein
MAPHMICVFPVLTSNATIRRLRISVPLIECLVDGVRYFRPHDLPAPSGDELRSWVRPRLTRDVYHRRSPHRDAALGQDDGNPRRAAVELAIEGRTRPAAPAQHLADRDAAGGSQGPDGQHAPLTLFDQR